MMDPGNKTLDESRIKPRRAFVGATAFGLALGLVGVVGKKAQAATDGSGPAILILLRQWWAAAQEYQKTFNGYVDSANSFFKTAEQTHRFIDRIKSIDEVIEAQRKQVVSWFESQGKRRGSWTRFRLQKANINAGVAVLEMEHWMRQYKRMSDDLDKLLEGMPEDKRSGAKTVLKKAARTKAQNTQAKAFAAAMQARLEELERATQASTFDSKSRAEVFSLEVLPLLAQIQIRQLQSMALLNEQMQTVVEMWGTGKPVEDSPNEMTSKDFEDLVAAMGEGDYDWSKDRKKV